jgi:outer membrane lipoprotein-sorting protein
MKFLRTASTGRLMAMLLGLIAAVAGGTAIAVAATGSGPVPAPKPLATAVHDALSAKPVNGITAHIQFTNNLISSANFTGESIDPILQGASGRLWLSGDHQLRLELQSNNGDAQVVVNKTSFWISDPMSKTVYEGTLPADKPNAKAHDKSAAEGVPSVAKIQSEITRLMKGVSLTGAGSSDPTDVAGQPAYSVQISPKHSGGLLGSAQLAWDAANGVPLDVAVLARNDSTPVLELKATSISFGHVASSVFNVSPPPGDKVVKVSTAATHGTAASAARTAKGAHAAHKQISGVAAVRSHVPFKLIAAKSLVGLPRHGVTLLDWAGKPAALLTYGQSLGGMAVIEQSASKPATASGHGAGSNLSLPTVSINGASGTELATALGTVVSFTSGGVSYTVIGSVSPYAAETAARALTKPAP